VSWAHEYLHTKLPGSGTDDHRIPDQRYALMNVTFAVENRVINEKECDAALAPHAKGPNARSRSIGNRCRPVSRR